MSKKIVLIDGHSILNRAFYGVPDLTNAEGLHTNAVYGFLNILFKILGEENPAYLTVAFDRKEPTFRHEMYAEYKGTRKGMPQELHEQVPVMKEVLHAMGIKVVEQPGIEADDILGTISRKAEQDGFDVSIISGDRDLLQLATKKIKIRIPKTKKTGTEIEDYYEADVLEKYQVTPLEFIDLKALMGDASDNIPGVPGIGEKTAAKIIVQYKNIETAYAHVDEITPAKAQNSLRENYDLAVLSKKLAKIRLDCELDFDLEQAKIGDLFTQEAYLLFRKLEFKNYLSKFEKKDTETSKQPNIRTIADRRTIEAVLKEAGEAKRVALSAAVVQENVCFALTFNEEETVQLCSGEEMEGQELIDSIHALMAKEHLTIFHDLKGMLRYVKPDRERFVFDCQLGAYLLNPLKNSYHYDELLQEYAGELLPAYQSVSDAAKISCYESYTAYKIYDKIMEKLIETEMEELYRTIELPLVFVLHDMEEAGIRVQADELLEYGEKLKVRIDELEKQIYRQAGETFNINSPKQLGVILFEKLQMPNGKKTKTGYSTAADVLEKLAPDYPIVSDILEYRQLAKLKSTYADGLAGFIGKDGRIHSNFNQTITATGRISSTEPNLQNIPIRMELGRLIRKVFVPEDGYVFVDADYSQIELRVLAHMSGDEALIKAYGAAEDIHKITASQVFHVPFEEVTDLQRRNAKAVNFGIVYGISSFGLSQDLSISRKEAAEYIDRYFETYPDIKTFLDNLVIKAKETGYAVTMFNRRRPIPELSSSNFMQRSFGERIAMNSPIQGTAADIIKIAMIRVSRRLRSEKMESRLILQVHDELLIEAKESEVGRVLQILEEEMTGAANLKVKLEIDAHTGKNWYEAK